LPQGIDTLALYINTDIFNGGIKIPQTWEEFNMAAKELTVKDADKGKLGVALGTYDNALI
jgi:maltose-binding protein MalE